MNLQLQLLVKKLLQLLIQVFKIKHFGIYYIYVLIAGLTILEQLEILDLEVQFS